MFVVTVAGRKGGIGKTTTAANLAAALAMMGERVLAVDADSQGHLAPVLGVAGAPLFALWASGAPLVSVAVPSVAAFGPGCLALVSGDNASLRLGLDAAGAVALAARLQAGAGDLGLDWVILDSPAVGALQDFAIQAADLVVVPAPCHYLGASGAVDTAALVRQIAPAAQVLVLPTLYEKRERDARHWYAQLIAAFPVLLPAIPHRVAVAESLAVGVPLVAYKPKNEAAIAYTSAAESLRAAAWLGVQNG